MTNVFREAEHYSSKLRDALEEDRLDDFLLSFDVLRSDTDPALFRVEFLIIYGSPTVSVVVDQFGQTSFYHSEGTIGDEILTECDFKFADRQLWVAVADRLGEAVPA